MYLSIDDEEDDVDEDGSKDGPVRRLPGLDPMRRKSSSASAGVGAARWDRASGRRDGGAVDEKQARRVVDIVFVGL